MSLNLGDVGAPVKGALGDIRLAEFQTADQGGNVVAQRDSAALYKAVQIKPWP